MNYQRELDQLLARLEEEEKSSQASAPQLLRPLQQLCAGVLERIF